MKKRALAFFIAVVFVITVLASCGKRQESTTTPIASDEPTSQTAQATDPAYSEQTSAQTEPTIPHEIETMEPAETMDSNEPNDNMWSKFVSYETGIFDKITDTFDINEVTQFINDKNDMDSFTKKFNVKYYKIIGGDRCVRHRRFGIEIEKPGYLTQVIATSGYETIVKTNKGYLFVRYFFGEKIITEDYNIVSRGEQTFFAYYEPINFSSDNAKEKIGTLDWEADYWDMVNIDPDGKYDVSGSFGAPYLYFSYHYFTDGTGYEIKYDEKYYVEEITKISI